MKILKCSIAEIKAKELIDFVEGEITLAKIEENRNKFKSTILLVDYTKTHLTYFSSSLEIDDWLGSLNIPISPYLSVYIYKDITKGEAKKGILDQLDKGVHVFNGYTVCSNYRINFIGKYKSITKSKRNK